MKIIKQVTLFFLFMGLTYSVNANSIIESLSFCDHRFFDKVKHDSQLDTLPQNITLSQLFSDSGLTIPLQYTTEEGIELTRFVAIAIDLERDNKISNNKIDETFYYWGFETSLPEQEVIQRLSTQIPLTEGGEFYVANSMMRDAISAPWQKNLTPISRISPTNDWAEKLFFIEANKESGIVRIMCTLQGNVNENDLKTVGLIN
ncbi:hypothetical protein U0L13_002255 [Providencia stuartii]|nr:hypothetical protein [Providencia stuartii]